MLKSTYALMTAIAIFASAATAQADCGSCGPKGASAEPCAAGACSAEKCTTAASGAGQCSATECNATQCNAAQCDSAKGCPIAAAMERLPKITYAVGEKKTCCPKEAAKIAKESGGHIHYCVAERQFDSESEAQTALVESTEEFVADFAKPSTCSKSGQVTLAGQAQSCEKTAARTAQLMQEAMGKVKLAYLVGEKQCNCPVEAGRLSQESGKAKLFVVGEEKTPCEKTARLNLARAKYKAAVEALLKSQASAAKPQAAAGT